MGKTGLLKKKLSPLIIAIFIFAGCSQQYIEKQFNSRDEFYSEINHSIKHKNANIEFLSGKNISSDNIYIKGDSAYWTNRFTEHNKMLIPLALAKNIDIKSYISQNPVIFNGNIQLTNDSLIEVHNAAFLQDTISYNLTHIKLFSSPLNEVSSFSYYNHIKAISQYGFAGIFLGGVIGYKAGSDAPSQSGESYAALGAVAGSILFGLGGVVAGVIIGNPQIYLLKNNDSETIKFIKKFGIIAGMTSSTLNGGFSDGRLYNTTEIDNYTFGLYYLFNINNILKFRPEIMYSIKGGNYNYSVNPVEGNFHYIEGGTSALYLDMIEAPMLLQLDFSTPKNNTLKFMAGPSLNFPIRNEIDEYYLGPMGSVYEHSIQQFNAKPYLSILFGAGVKWDLHFSTEFMFDHGIQNSGKVEMSDGTKLNLLQDDFLISTVFSF